MQIVTYENLLGESVVFGAAPPYVLAHVEGTESADVDRKTMKGALQHGETTESVLRQDRALELTINLITLSRVEMYHTRAQLCSALGAESAFDPQTGQRARIVYRNDFGQWWTWAVPRGAPKFQKRIQDIHPSMKITFDCDSPFWFSMKENHGGFSVGDVPFRMPLRFPLRFAAREAEVRLQNSGHVRTPVRIIAKGEGEKPSIVNQTTGKRISFIAPLPEGTEMEINTDPSDLFVRLRHNGTESNAFGYLEVSTPLTEFYLAPGPNLVAYESGSASQKTAVDIYWRDRFEGV